MLKEIFVNKTISFHFINKYLLIYPVFAVVKSKEDYKMFLEDVTKCKVNVKQLRDNFKEIGKAALTSSYIIFYSKYEKDWMNLNVFL